MAVQGAAAGGQDGQAILDYQAQLLAHITRFRAYPDAARPLHLVGVTLVRFAMTRDGRVLKVWIERTSGQATLDAAAEDTIRRAQPLPPIPAGLPSVLMLALPVDFSLNGDPA
jgi:protein TonB